MLNKNYNIEVLEYLPNSDLYFFSKNEKDTKDGLIIRVEAKDNLCWNGIFAFGDIKTRQSKSGVYSMPDPNILCVVSSGAGYIVLSNNPKDWESVDCTPILDVLPITSKNIILFVSYTMITAYDCNGLKWKSSRLGYDSFEILEVTGDTLKGQYWNIRVDGFSDFSVNLENGKRTADYEIF